MKLGFLDLKTNEWQGAQALVFDLANKEANLEVVTLSVPDLLKTPVGVKKLFAEQNADAVIAFLQADAEDDRDAIALIHEKILDLEIEYSRYAFYCIVLTNEWSTQNALESVSTKKLSALFEQVMSFNLGITPPPAQVTGSAMDFFGPSNELPSPEQEAKDVIEEQEVHKLF